MKCISGASKAILGALFAATLVMSWTSSTDAGRKTTKEQRSGILTDSVFTDTVFKYSVPVSDQWKLRTESIDSDLRLTMNHKKPHPFAVGVPTRIQFTVIEKDLKPLTVIDSMSSPDCSWENARQLWADLRPSVSGYLKFGSTNVLSRKPMSVGGRAAASYKAKVRFDLGGGSETKWSAILILNAIQLPKGVLLMSVICDHQAVELTEAAAEIELSGIAWLP